MNKNDECWAARRPSRGALSALLLALVPIAACTAPAPVRWDSPSLAKCEKKIGALTRKLDRKLTTALGTCKRLYRASVAGGMPLSSGAVSGCDAALAKSFLFPDPNTKSAVSKVKSQLDELVVDAHCSDADLLALGHAPVGPLGDQWARLIVLQRIKAAWESEAQSTNDLADVFKEYVTAGCVHCAALAEPPCRRSTCTLAPGSAINFASDTPVPLTGSLSFDVCRSPLLGSDFALFGAPSSGSVSAFDTSGSLAAGVQYACIRMLGATGLIQNVSSALIGPAAVNVCQDHLVGAPDSDECAVGGAICSSTAADPEHPGSVNGGVCTEIAPGGVIVGGAFVLGRFEVSFVGTGASPSYPDTRGADGVPCTYDDTAAGPTVSFSAPLGNGVGVTGALYDHNAVDGVLQSHVFLSPPLFDPLRVAAGDLSGGTLATVLPALHSYPALAGSPFADQLTAARFDCQ